MSNQSPALAAACLSVGLVSAWAPSALGDIQTQVTVTSSLYGSVEHATFLFTGAGLGSGGPGLITTERTVPAGLTGLTYLTMLFTDSITSFGDGFAMIGLSHGSSGSDPYHLVLSTPGLTSLSGLSFEQAFPGGPTEAQLIDQLLTGGPGAEFFLRTNFAILGRGYDLDSPCFSFSNGAPFGLLNVSVTSVPAPAALALLPLGYITQLRRRRS